MLCCQSAIIITSYTMGHPLLLQVHCRFSSPDTHRQPLQNIPSDSCVLWLCSCCRCLLSELSIQAGSKTLLTLKDVPDRFFTAVESDGFDVLYLLGNLHCMDMATSPSSITIE